MHLRTGNDKIAELIDQYEYAGNPVAFRLTPKPRSWGNCSEKERHPRRPLTRSITHSHTADGAIFPHGIFDPVRNRGHINLGLSHDMDAQLRLR